MLIGDIIAISAMRLGLNVTYFPSYGVEMRGDSKIPHRVQCVEDKETKILAVIYSG